MMTASARSERGTDSQLRSGSEGAPALPAAPAANGRLRRALVVGLAAVAAAPAFATVTPSAEAASLTVGSRGSAVLALTERLAELGYLPRERTTSVFMQATHHAAIAFQKHERLARDGVVGPRTQAALRDARRPRLRLAAGGRRIEVWRYRQIALLVWNGAVVRVVAVSTGKAGYATPPGRFSVYRRERMSWSYSFRDWLPWAAYFNRGIAFHGYTSVPVYPASHGCVRVPLPFARGLYGFARLGTRVDVV